MYKFVCEKWFLFDQKNEKEKQMNIDRETKNMQNAGLANFLSFRKVFVDFEF